MFDESYESLMEEYLSYAPDGIDTREGSIYYDAGAGFIFLLFKFYTALRFVYEQKGFSNAIDEDLMVLGEDYANITRKKAESAEYEFVYDGTKPDLGARFMTENRYFSVISSKGELFLKAEEPGSMCNNISPGTPAIPVKTIDGLKSASFGDLHNSGADLEDIEVYRERLRSKASLGNNTSSQYRAWCVEVGGAASARILARVPDEDGRLVIYGVIIDENGNAANSSTIAEVQKHIDPDKAGMGNGTAGIGLPFIAIAPKEVIINVKISIDSLATGYTKDEAQQEVKAAIVEYLKKINLEMKDSEIVLRAPKVGAMLLGLDSDCITDYNTVTIMATIDGSGYTDRIPITPKQYAKVGEVTLNVGSE